MTFSQSGRNGRPCRTSAAFCPGPSNVIAFHPRVSAQAIPSVHAPTTEPSLPLLKISVRRGSPAAPDRKKYPGSVVPSYGISMRSAAAPPKTPRSTNWSQAARCCSHSDANSAGSPVPSAEYVATE
jgi:hypothetical protein